MQEETTSSPAGSEALATVRVAAMRLECPDVLSIELRDIDGDALSPAPPGSHVDVHFTNGVKRPYSVVSGDGGIYVLAVKREPDSQGGSAYVIRCA